jgi:hypothetical protein
MKTDTFQLDLYLQETSPAPRVTLADVNAAIKSEHYFTAANGYIGSIPDTIYNNVHVPGALGLLTFCVLVLQNGFTVTGQSACASPANFNKAIGEKIARDNAVAQIWPLLGFELRSKLARGEALRGDKAVPCVVAPLPEPSKEEALLARLRKEREELNEKCVRLAEFLPSPACKALCEFDQADLESQHVAMVIYLTVLDRRIKRFAERNGL